MKKQHPICPKCGDRNSAIFLLVTRGSMCTVCMTRELEAMTCQESQKA